MFILKADNIKKNLDFDVKLYYEKPLSFKIVDVTIWQKIKIEVILNNGKELFWTPVIIDVHNDKFELLLEEIKN